MAALERRLFFSLGLCFGWELSSVSLLAMELRACPSPPALAGLGFDFAVLWDAMQRVQMA